MLQLRTPAGGVDGLTVRLKLPSICVTERRASNVSCASTGRSHLGLGFGTRGMGNFNNVAEGSSTDGRHFRLSRTR